MMFSYLLQYNTLFELQLIQIVLHHWNNVYSNREHLAGYMLISRQHSAGRETCRYYVVLDKKTGAHIN